MEGGDNFNCVYACELSGKYETGERRVVILYAEIKTYIDTLCVCMCVCVCVSVMLCSFKS